MKKKMLLTLFIVLLLFLMILIAYFGFIYPPLGKNPHLKTLAKFTNSPNFKDGQFINQIDTPTLTTNQSQISLIFNIFFTPKLNNLRPNNNIPAIKTDLTKLRDNSIIWLGHSSYFVRLAGKNILIDPIFSEHASPLPITGKSYSGTNIYCANDMPTIDVLLITHDHYDHLDYPSIKSLVPTIKSIITPLGVGSHFQHWRIDADAITELDWYQDAPINHSLTITATPARHFSGRTFIKNKTLWAGFVLRSNSFTLFFSGDTGYGPHFAEIGAKFGGFDWIALDSGQYDKRWQNIHMTPEQAAQAAFELKTKAFLPQHIGRFQLANHVWNEPFERITTAVKNYNYQLTTPIIGEIIALDNLQSQTFNPWWQKVQ